MPNAVVKSYAEKTGKSVEHVERWWDEAKEEALKKFGKKNKSFWAYVNGIVKRRAGLSEQLTFKDYMLLEELMNNKIVEGSGHITEVLRDLEKEFEKLSKNLSKEQMSKLETTTSGNIWELVRILERNIEYIKQNFS